MILFKEKYKNAYDKIEGDKTQIAKILAAANNSSSTKKKFVFPFKFGTAFAALLVIGISIYSLPKMQDVNDPIENKTKKYEVNDVVENAAFGTYSNPSEDDSAEKNSTEKSSVPTAPQTTSMPSEHDAQNKADEPVDEAKIETTEEEGDAVEAPANSGAGREAASAPSVAAYDEPIAVKGARSIKPDIVTQYTVEFPETMGYASVTVYTKNENIANAFLSRECVLVSDKSVIISGDEIDRFAMIKLQDAYAEVYAQNISEQELMDVIANISL